MASFASKLKEAATLISRGRFKQLFSRIIDMTLKTKSRDLKYLYIRKKYSAFITDKVNDNLRNRGGGKTTETPNIIWWLWLQGEENAPDICKACLRSLRRWHSDKKIITLDSNNLHEYITLPDYINEKYEKGIISHTHYSDIVRLQLLTEHGGTWIDSTMYCTGRKFEYVMHLPLFLLHEVESFSFCSVAPSFFMVSALQHPVITLARDIIFQYWKDYNYLTHYFLINFVMKMAADPYKGELDKMPFLSCGSVMEMEARLYQDYTEEKMNHFREISDFHKLTYKLNPEHMPSEKSIYHHVVYDE